MMLGERTPFGNNVLTHEAIRIADPGQMLTLERQLRVLHCCLTWSTRCVSYIYATNRERASISRRVSIRSGIPILSKSRPEADS